jgi:hypothetical protein
LKGLGVGGVIFRNAQVCAGFNCGLFAWQLVYEGSQKSQNTTKTMVCSLLFRTRYTDSSGDFITYFYQVVLELKDYITPKLIDLTGNDPLFGRKPGTK